ncbi:hypothetical protein DPMN_109249 [Dreissena polymorpha]|uniref:Uncharacterized protein n=1 Tax=Dreissena polymorpha TaxID=45954 RepID=A0A9D4KA81_DREPO|nr:hypothetical protein DPMN_109249 [Dreissena polymorpha]
MNATLAERTFRVKELRAINRRTSFIFAANLIILEVALKKLFGVSAMLKKTDAEKIKTVVSINKDTLVFQYLFAFFDSMQGFLFLVQCMFDKKKSASRNISASTKKPNSHHIVGVQDGCI